MTRSTKFRLLAVVVTTVGLLASLLGPIAVPASAVASVETKRLGGADRFATAAEVARESHRGAQTALIANGMNFPDALAGSTLAGAVKAPILLVTPTSVPAATSSALTDIGVREVVILGGPAAVSPQVEAQLRQNYGVTRVQGDDRYKTAVEISRRASAGGIGTVGNRRTAFVSTGLNFPDALGAGPLAYQGKLPSFLTRTNELPAEVAQAFRDLRIEHVVILGGTQAVSAAVEAQIKATGATTERLSGRNRAETATFVADFALARMGFEGVNTILSRGDNFPDALAGGPLGGERRAVILLTATPCQLAIETRQWLEDHFNTVARIFVLGGPNAVCDAVVREAKEAAQTNNLPPSRVALTIAGGSMNGGPKWQYQQSGANPSKSLTLKALVTSDPPQGSGPEAQRTPASGQDVVFNIKPSQGDHADNAELNLTGRTDANGEAQVSYTRSRPGTDIITVRVRKDTTIVDDGVGRWDTQAMPMSLTPDTAQTLSVDQPRSFRVCVPGPTGEPTANGVEINLTTLELIDNDPNNDTIVAALRFSSNVTDDRADNDQTIGKVTTRGAADAPAPADGCRDFTVSSNAAQTFTLMAFIDSVSTPAANKDNLNPPEFRDLAGPTSFGSTRSGLNMTPANDNNANTAIVRRNGQQIVYTVTAVDPQGQPLSSPVDVSFEQLTDDQPGTTTTAEFDWFDNSARPSTQAGSEDQVPPGATPTAANTRRIEVVPNADGVFTFAITNPQRNTVGTSGNPIAWVDLPGGVDNRPDANEPQARGENFVFNTGSVTAQSSLETLGCPPGVPQRGTQAAATVPPHPPFNPVTVADPCLGRDIVPEDPHVPWPLTLLPVSPDGANAATCIGRGTEAAPNPDAGKPNPATISRGDLVARFTYRDATGAPVSPGLGTVTFQVTNDSFGPVHAAPNRPNSGCDTSVAVPPFSRVLVTIPLAGAYAELVVDGGEASATIEIVATSFTDVQVCGQSSQPCDLRRAVRWIQPTTDTTSSAAIPAGTSAPAARCPSPAQPCFNGNLVVIDKARDSYVMNRGMLSGGTAYVVYAIGGGGRLYGTTVTQGERPPPAVDHYFIDGLAAPGEPQDDQRCGFASTEVQVGCARFEAAMSFDDNMVYEFSGFSTPTGTVGPVGPRRTQTHFLTNGTAPTPQ